jgi:hypothetical protein
MVKIGTSVAIARQNRPLQFFAMLIFRLAGIRTFFAPSFSNLAHRFHRDTPSDKMLVTLFHFFGKVEVVFGLWITPLIFAIFVFSDWHAVTVYFHSVTYVESLFIVAIMVIASSQPVLFFARTCMQRALVLGNHTPSSWWLSIMVIGPLLGSFIAESAAVTISALLLAQ